jgi:hypothetical protein
VGPIGGSELGAAGLEGRSEPPRTCSDISRRPCTSGPAGMVFGNNTPLFRSRSRRSDCAIIVSSGARSARASACDGNCKSRPVAREDKMPVSPVPCCRPREGALALSRRGSRLIERPTHASYHLRGARQAGQNKCLEVGRVRAWTLLKSRTCLLGWNRDADQSAFKSPGVRAFQVAARPSTEVRAASAPKRRCATLGHGSADA